MAKQKGYIRIKGSLGGLTFYENDGQGIIRTTGGVDADKIKKDPAFKRTRENMAEFGGSAKVAKAFRMGFANIVKTMGDRTLTGRITGLMKKVNALGTGNRGERGFEIVAHKDLIEGFEFNKNEPLGATFYAPAQKPTLNANRDVATYVVPDFNTDNYINAPEGATHFKLVLAATVLSDYVYNNAGKGYEPVHAAENETNGIAFSTEIALGGLVGAATTLTVDLGFGSALPATVGVICAVGIVFYQQINAQFYELASANAMRIDVVG